MPELTRQRTSDRHETWTIRYGDVDVGTIAQEDWDPNPERSGAWQWSCGFYPLHRDQCFRGVATGLRNGASRLRCRLERVSAEAHRSRVRGLAQQWTANKYALWDAGYTEQIRRGEIHCPCGKTFNPRFHEQTMAYISHITGRAPGT
ncbi:hypothetical protein [Tardiphaga sp. 862_B3_N1_1]|uniref:hypothetical protein n=1 Tax=Tardiphaga sp. 862_B3_N1_1 TaxID=3240763 RepID=UPI003F89C74A